MKLVEIKNLSKKYHTPTNEIEALKSTIKKGIIVVCE